MVRPRSIHEKVEARHTVPNGLLEKPSRVAIIALGDQPSSFATLPLGDNRFIAGKFFRQRDFAAVVDSIRKSVFRLTEVDFDPRSHFAPMRGKRMKRIKPPNVSKLDWGRRFSLFSRFDNGIQMDLESWYEVTPENVARYISAKTSRCKGVIDCFCGVGGNFIQFALRHGRVVGVDSSASRLRMALANAKLYGVNELFDDSCMDTLQYLEAAKASAGTCLYMSPPWGGKECYKYPKLSISVLPVNLEPLIQIGIAKFGSIILHLPRNIDLEEIGVFLQKMGIEYFEVEAVYYTHPKRHLKFFLVYIDRESHAFCSLYEKVREQYRSSVTCCLGPSKSARLIAKSCFGGGLFSDAILKALRSDSLEGVTRRIIQ